MEQSRGTDEQDARTRGINIRRWVKELLRQVSQTESYTEDVTNERNDSDNPTWERLYVSTSPVIEFGATIAGTKHEVMDVVPGSYADELKLRPGDELSKLGSNDLTALPSAEVRQLFRLVHGETQLVIRRPNELVQCVVLPNSRRQEYHELHLTLSCQYFQERIQPLIEYPLEAEPTLRRKKIYTAYIKSIYCSNQRGSDCCLKLQSDEVTAEPIRNGEEQLHKVRVNNYQNHRRTDGTSCLLEIGPNKKFIACRRGRGAGDATVYISSDASDAKVTGDDRLFVKKIISGRKYFESANLPGVYLSMDGTDLATEQIRDPNDTDTKSAFDVFSIRDRRLR